MKEHVHLMSESTMKRVMFYSPGDIRVEEAPIPEPGPGEVVIRVRAAGARRIAPAAAAVRPDPRAAVCRCR